MSLFPGILSLAMGTQTDAKRCFFDPGAAYTAIAPR